MTSKNTAPHLRAVPTPDEGAEPTRDDELVVRAADGDGRAWARLYQTHFDRVYRDLYYQLGNPAEAEELVQETFAVALRGLSGFDGRSSFVTWLRGIGHNLVRKHWRGKERRGRAYDRLEQTQRVGATGGEDPEASHLRDQRARVLSQALEELPVSLREVFILRDVQGVAVDDVAARLQISAGNVRVRANRARAKIREQLTRLGWLEGDA